MMTEAVQEQAVAPEVLVAVSTFTVANDKDGEVEAALLMRPEAGQGQCQNSAYATDLPVSRR